MEKGKMIVTKVKNTIDRYDLIDKGDTVIVGVSGGPDSVALLYLLNGLKKESRLNLHIAHLDHCLRKDSGKDRRFVEDLAKKLDLPVTCARINVKGLAKHGSLEEIARNARLGFLFKVAKNIKADKIALGHNLDDQAETVLMRILRGTGLYGLSGIMPKRNISGYQVIRPLIKVKRKEIEAYLKRKNIVTCIDKTNSQDIYFRNRIRNVLLPYLAREYSSNIKDLLSNTAESIAADYDYLVRSAAKYLKKPYGKIELGKALRMHPSLRRIALRLLIARIKGDMRRIGFKHIIEIEDMIFNRPVNSIVDLPKGVSVIKKKRFLYFYLRKIGGKLHHAGKT